MGDMADWNIEQGQMPWDGLGPEREDELINLLEKIRPLLTGEAGTYLGIYEDHAKNICKLMGWKN